MSADPRPFQLPDEPLENILARISRVPSPRVETETHIIHREPRISASLLGQYVVSDPTRQRTILKDSKFVRKGMIFTHAKARHALAMSFSNGGFDVTEIKRRAEALKEEAKTAEAMQQKENLLSASLLEKLLEMPGLPEAQNAQKLTRPATGWTGLEIAGVKVSFEPQVVFSFTQRNVTKLGAVIMHGAKAIPLDKMQHDHHAGDYVSALLVKMLETELPSVGVPSPAHCFVIDVHRGQTYFAPKKFKTLFNHMEAACEVIAALWSGIQLK